MEKKKKISVSLSPQLIGKLEFYCNRKGTFKRTSRSSVIETAVSEYLFRQKNKDKDFRDLQQDLINRFRVTEDNLVVLMEMVYKILKIFLDKYEYEKANSLIINMSKNIINDITHGNSFYDLLHKTLETQEKYRIQKQDFENSIKKEEEEEE